LYDERQKEQQAQLLSARVQWLQRASFCTCILQQLSISATCSSVTAPDLQEDWGRHDLLEALAAVLRSAAHCADLGGLAQLKSILRFAGESPWCCHGRLFQSCCAASLGSPLFAPAGADAPTASPAAAATGLLLQGS
jgi:hypothetical protein